MSTAIFGSNSAIDPSLSSTSLTKGAPPPTRALANPPSSPTKFFITAPFMITGSSPQSARIQPVMPVTVDLPLVPPMAMGSGAALNSSASNWARVLRGQPSRLAAAISGTSSSIAALAISVCPAFRPLPSCGNSVMPLARNQSNLSSLRP